MGIDNSGGDVVLPAEIQKRIDTTKKQIAINEQEVITLQKTRLSEEYAVRELLKSKEAIAKEIEIAESVKEITTANNAILTESSVKLIAENERLTAEFKVLKAKNEKEREFTDEREQNVAQRESMIADRELAVITREKSCGVIEGKQAKFAAKIKEALKEL